MSMRRTVCFLCLGLLGGCEIGAPKLARRELPGFSIELPVGRQLKTKHEELDYKLGEVTIAGTHGFSTIVTMVRWNPGERLTGPELELLTKAFGASKEFTAKAVAGTITRDGAQAETLQLVTSDGPMFISQVACGGRNLVLVTASKHGPAELHARIVTSIACHPDTAAEKTLSVTQIPLKLDLPGWYATSRDSNQLMLTDGASLLMLQPMPSSMKPETITQAAPMLDALFQGQLKAGAVSGNRVALSGAIEGMKVTGYMRLVSCPSAGVLMIGLSEKQPLADALDAKLAATPCLAPGQAAPTFPDAAAK
jgi:hypothetical protein